MTLPGHGSARSRRMLWWIFLGVVASAVVAWLLPDGAAGELHSSVVVTPVVLGLLAATGVGCRPGGTPEWRAAERTALVAWLVLALAHPALFPAGGTTVVVGAGFLLLLAHLWRRLPTLRSRLDGRHTPLALFLLPLAVYLAILPYATEQRPPDGDEPWYLLTAHSLAFDFDTDLANNYRDQHSLHFLDRSIGPQPGDPEGAHGERYSRHNPLLAAVLAPSYRLGGKLGVLVTMACVTALLSWFTARLLLRVWPSLPGAVLVQWAIVALAPPLLLYSHQIWVEVPGALLAVIALDRVYAMKERPGTRRSDWLVFAGCLLALPMLKLRFALLCASILLLALLHLRRHRTGLLLFGGAGAILAAGYLLYNRRTFGNALRIHGWEELLIFRRPLPEIAGGASGLFFDIAFGLFVAAPLWALILPAVITALRARTRDRRSGQHPAFPCFRDAAVLCLPYLLLVASRREWYGGWSPPFRYPLALLPFLAVVMVPIWEARRHPRARAVIAALGAATLLLTLLWIAIPGYTYAFADGRSRWLDVLTTWVGADLARLVPSGVRLRTATWITPLLLTALLILVWPYRRRTATRPRRARAAGALAFGAVAPMVVLAALPTLGELGPTRRVELESPHVFKSGGHPDPDLWMFDRRRFREAWALREGEHLIAPVEGGGHRLRIAAQLRPVFNRDAAIELQILDQEGLLHTIRFEEDDSWRVVETPPLPWHSDGPLVLSIPTGTEGTVVNGILLDRIDLTWSD